MQLGHFLSMCDDTGLFQHAVHSVPDRSHGYCVDDNARALLVACALNAPGEQRLSEALTARFAAFVQHAWNPDSQAVSQFHELRSPLAGRRARRTATGEHCGRWASARAAMPARRGGDGRLRLFAEALPTVEHFQLAARMGLHAAGPGRLLRRGRRGGAKPEEMRHLLGDRLMSVMRSVETEDWVWFEEGLAYDNARLSQALIVTGMCPRARRTTLLPA